MLSAVVKGPQIQAAQARRHILLIGDSAGNYLLLVWVGAIAHARRYGCGLEKFNNIMWWIYCVAFSIA
jgi:hypothetical protein